MSRLVRSLLLLAYVLSGMDVEGCSSACIRHTDCSSNERCMEGSCIIVAAGDGSTVDAMTPAPSATTTPTATSTATSTPVDTTPIDSGISITPIVPDASLDSSAF